MPLTGLASINAVPVSRERHWVADSTNWSAQNIRPKQLKVCKVLLSPQVHHKDLTPTFLKNLCLSIPATHEELHSHPQHELSLANLI